MDITPNLRNVILKLFQAEALKFGDFTLKSGIRSPVYFDLRVIISYPQLLADIADLLWDVTVKRNVVSNCICGVPYTALPIATCIAVKHNIPMLIKRKEAKDYGTKKMIEGQYSHGCRCIVIEDVVTSGSSVLETVKALREANITTTDAVVFLDRNQGGSENLKREGVNLHKVVNIDQVLTVLHDERKISSQTLEVVKKFLADNMNVGAQDNAVISKYKRISFGIRATKTNHPVAKKLFQIMEKKKTNLTLSADVDTSNKLLQLADELGPYICVLKTHVDILEDFDMDVAEKLVKLSEQHHFLILEDRKFSDIGATVKQQYQKGMHKICNWADIVTVHSIPGSDIVRALKEVDTEVTRTAGAKKERACLLIAQMSSRGNLIDNNYTQETVKMALEHSDFVIGFISQSRLTDDPMFIHMTPGVNRLNNMDTLGQQYLSPKDAVVNKGADIIIVGRGITTVRDPVQITRSYRDLGWNAYERLIPPEREIQIR